MQDALIMVMKVVKLAMCLLTLHIYVLQVAQGAMSCDGEHQYVDEEGHCRMCELCPPGFEPKPVS